MRYIKIKGESYRDAIQKLKTQHGDDAIPISHKNVKEGGILNSRFFGKEVVELTAAVQEKGINALVRERKSSIDVTVGDTPRRDRHRASPSATSAAALMASPRRETFSSMLQRDMAQEKRATPEAQDSRSEPVAKADEEKENEMLMELLRAGREEVSDQKEREEPLEGITVSEIRREFADMRAAIRNLRTVASHDHGDAKVAPELAEWDTVLEYNDYDASARAEMIEQLKSSVPAGDMKNRSLIERSFRDLLKSRIVTAGPIKKGARKKIVMFVGPTGVGKTTTMAKLGAISKLREKQSVAFVTVDNYRIAATEQLKKYAEILNIPIHAVNTQAEFHEVVDSEKADIIMVDTSGRSHRNDLKIAEIQTYVNDVEYDVEKILCVSAGTKKRDVEDVLRAFSVLEYSSIAITKVDESSFVGNVVDVADKYNKPISYITNGQEVPNDIAIADAEALVDLMIGDSDSQTL